MPIDLTRWIDRVILIMLERQSCLPPTTKVVIMDRARIRVALGELIGRINIICDDMGYLAILEEVGEYTGLTTEEKSQVELEYLEMVSEWN